MCPRHRVRARLPSPTLFSALLAAALIVAAAVAYLVSLAAPRLIPGLTLQSEPVGGVAHAELERVVRRVADKLAATPLVLRFGSAQLAVDRRELGVRFDLAATQRRLGAIGKTGDPLADVLARLRARRGALDVPLAAALDAERARSFFLRLKGAVDRPAVAPRLDLERGVVVLGAAGYRIQLHDALAAAHAAVRAGEREVPLPVVVLAAPGNARLAGVEVQAVLGEFSTVYSLSDKDVDRAHNLRVAASKLDGQVIRPGQQLSFNAVVGPRTELEGYRAATVITQGELVDGMAGGACQLSSTLFAAAFFAGLDLVSSRPHTIPSSYIKMGLDAAVAYPTTDLVIRNPYPFPVVLHYRVTQGRLTVAIRGPRRPWKRVVFTRRLVEKQPFGELVRDDPTIPRGARLVRQVGIPGFAFERERAFFSDDGKTPVKVEKRVIRYPPTQQIISRGSGPADPRWQPPPPRPPFGDASEELTVSQ